MRAARSWWLVVVLAAMLFPAEAIAQGRGRGGEQGRGRAGDDGDRGPAFCRSGAGHPVFGWEWCEQRGWGRDRDRARPQASRDARRNPSRDRDRFPDRDADRRFDEGAFDNGYADGSEKGLDDGRDRREHDPVRHRWYREGDRGYDSRSGSRAQYQNVYRDGFRRGYDAGYRDGERADRGGGLRLPWPF